jgi:hypothetical protein
MQGGNPMCKITGDQKRIQLNVGSLEEALGVVQRIYREFQKPEAERDTMLLDAMTCYAVVLYTKCFNSDLSDKLDPQIFSDDLPDSATPADLSEREFHSMVMNYRNLHLVHSDKLLKIADTGGVTLPGGQFGVGPVVASRVFREEQGFYGGLNSLVTKALTETKRRMENAQGKLSSAVSSGVARITDDPIQLMPVSDILTPREMWGLPPRQIRSKG